MSERPTPKTKWYVTEYPEECDFAITDGNEIFATIIGGKTIGDQCDLASRIAKLPDLERERDEAREKMADALQEVDLRTLDFDRMKQEREEAREKYATEATEHMLAINKLCNERDEAREEANKLSGAYEDATNYYARIIDLKEELDEAREKLSAAWQSLRDSQDEVLRLTFENRELRNLSNE